MRRIDLEAEASFENRKAAGEAVRSKQDKFYWATELPTNAHRALTLSVIKNHHVLEIGCASGYDAIDYAKQAKKNFGIDISNVAIDNCKKLEIQNAEFYCVDGHKIPLDNGSIDFVIVNSLLHHLDLNVVFKEISRVLKIEGKLIFKEPLGTNPFFQLYRRLTPKARTVDERPFTFADLKLMQSYFNFENIRWFGFLNVFSAFLKFKFVRSLLSEIDRFLSFTPLKYFYWQFSGIAKLKR